jgi:type II secretory pathway pseudopilin PulG
MSVSSTESLRIIDCRHSIFRRDHEHRLVPLDGFTLLELLIVMAATMILMPMSMGTYGSIKKRADEISAVNSVRVIATSETIYTTSYPTRGFACTLTALGRNPATGDPTPHSCFNPMSPQATRQATCSGSRPARNRVPAKLPRQRIT